MGFFPCPHYTRQDGFLKGGTGNVRILSYVGGNGSAARGCRNILWRKQVLKDAEYKVLFDKGPGTCYSTHDGVSN